MLWLEPAPAAVTGRGRHQYDPDVRPYRAADLEQCAQILDKASTAFGWALVRSTEHLKKSARESPVWDVSFSSAWAGSRDCELPHPAIAWTRARSHGADRTRGRMMVSPAPSVYDY